MRFLHDARMTLLRCAGVPTPFGDPWAVASGFLVFLADRPGAARRDLGRSQGRRGVSARPGISCSTLPPLRWL